MKELLQRFLHSQGLYSGKFDGLLGPKSMQAINALLLAREVSARGWDDNRRYVAALQIMARDAGLEPGKIDGFNGPQTRYAMELYVNRTAGRADPVWRDADISTKSAPVKSTWPAYRDIEKVFGPPGGPACTAGKVKVPFHMTLAWDKSSVVKAITCHEKVADSLGRILSRVASTYTQAQLDELGISLFGGSFNKRLMRGGTQWSTHSWGIALDFDPVRNGLHTHKPNARLSHDDAVNFWKIWEAEGWLSLGRAKNYDWMHVQAAGL